jgi:hypothetical protein
MRKPLKPLRLVSDGKSDNLNVRNSPPGGYGQNGEVPHVGNDVDDAEEDDRPCYLLYKTSTRVLHIIEERRCARRWLRTVEGDIFVKRDDVVQRCPPKKRDEVPANWEENEDDLDCDCQDLLSKTRGKRRYAL